MFYLSLCCIFLRIVHSLRFGAVFDAFWLKVRVVYDDEQLDNMVLYDPAFSDF